MSEEHDYDLPTDISTEATEKIDDAQHPVEAAKSVAPGDPVRELLPMLGGGALLLSALRSLKEGKLRAIPIGAAGAGLLSYGLRNRRSSEDEPSTFEPDTDEIEGGTEGKETSDQASAAAERTDSGRESQIDAAGEIDDSAQLGDEGETGSRIEFTDDAEQEEPRTKPDHVGDEADPRRDTDDDTVEVDVSDTAMAEEVSEAAGPDPEQAQPTQTDATEPEETPEEDASDMKVEPDEDEDDEPSETAGEDDGGDEEAEADAETDDEDDVEE